MQKTFNKKSTDHTKRVQANLFRFNRMTLTKILEHIKVIYEYYCEMANVNDSSFNFVSVIRISLCSLNFCTLPSLYSRNFVLWILLIT